MVSVLQSVTSSFMLDLEQIAALWEQHGQAAAAQAAHFSVGPTRLEIGRELKLMGVVNLSQQSWYRESVCVSAEAAIRRAHILAAEGADLIDVGGESTLAHADRVSTSDQIQTLAPITKALVAAGIPVSIETYSAAVAEAVLDAGASVINMTGTGESEAIYKLASQGDTGVIVSYVQGENPREVSDLTFPSDPFTVFQGYFSNEIQKASASGFEKVIIDPGLGFYYKNLQDGKKRVAYQINTLLQTFRLHPLGKPICHALPHAFEFFENEVRSAEPFFAVVAALGKTHLFRTHEVSKVRSVLETMKCA